MPVVLPAGCTLIELDCVESTNDEAKRLAAQNAPDATVVWAREQTAGRGRRGREWSSPAGNLYVSILLRPDKTPREAAQLSLVTAVALGDAIQKFLPENVSLLCKWPNDILVNGHKAAGILLESAGGNVGRATEWIVVGCGVNIASHPENTMYSTTDLHAEGCEAITVDTFLERFAECFFIRRDEWLSAGIEPVRRDWMARAAGFGEMISVRLPNRETHGRFVGMDDDGALILEGKNGQRESIAAGDVFL